MTRVFSITENPFVWGLRHRSLEATNKECGLPVVAKFSTGYEELANNALPISNWWVDGYRLGRTIRFCITVPLAFADLILQIFQSIAHTFEALALFVDIRLRCNPGYSFFQKFYLTNLIFKIRKLVSREDYRHFVLDVGLVDSPYGIKTIPTVWRSFLDCLPHSRKC